MCSTAASLPRPTRWSGVVLFAAATLLATAAVAASGSKLQRKEIEFFEGRIRPVLVEHCYSCHSASAESVKGGLLLDTAAGLSKGGESGAVVVPGDPAKSRLLLAVRYTDSDLRMPPKRPLSSSQIDDLETWIQMGAPDPRDQANVADPAAAANHWSFQRLQAAPPPKVRNRAWSADPIDLLVLARLEAAKLAPAAPASKPVWLRRATFALTGLPPTPDEIEAFERDQSGEAHARVIDRLLESPHFGERWGRHWLDVVRYADSNGLESNVPYPNAWRYRDYVIRSFNEDKSFQDFVVEQLAGDLLPAATEARRHELWIATGFLVLGPKALAEPDPDKLAMDVVDDQIDVTTRAFLGLTVSCARCHDHKFDPIPTKDYYALAGVFRSTTTLVEEPPRNPAPVRWVERSLAPPAMAAAFEDYTRRFAAVQQALREAKRRKQELPGNYAATNLTGIVVDNAAAVAVGAWRSSTYATNFINKDYVHDDRADKGKKALHFIPAIPTNGLYQVLFAFPYNFNRATNTPVTITAADGTRTLRIDQTQPPAVDNLFAPLGTFRFDAGTNGCVIVSTEGTSGFVVADAVRFILMPEGGPPEGAMAMKPAAVSSRGAERAMTARAREELQREFISLRTNAPPTPPTAMAVREGKPVNCRIHLRGDPAKLGPEVPRAILTALAETAPPAALDQAEQSGRLELARWIAHPQNPLTARVAANRVWLHLFGRGLVDTPDNFGLLGEPPSHPELLDYLADEFIRHGWSTKKLIRRIMLTQTYRMAAQPARAAGAAVDPDNRLLWHAGRRRLDAESLRDAMLAASGALDRTAGGTLIPAATAAGPPEPTMPRTEPLGASTRRSVYLPVVRNNLPDVFQVFDFADPHAINGRRHTTTAAPQALFLLNSPFVMDQSRKFAGALLAADLPDDDARVRLAYLKTRAVPPNSAERDAALRFLDRFTAAAAAEGAGGVRRASSAANHREQAWQAFCQALFASSEFRYLD